MNGCRATSSIEGLQGSPDGSNGTQELGGSSVHGTPKGAWLSRRWVGTGLPVLVVYRIQDIWIT